MIRGVGRFVTPVLIFVALLFSSQTALAQFSQQGPKLVGSGAMGNAEQGYSVALSADGNTAIIGAPDDNSAVGAAWVFARSNGVWAQQGGKLAGSDAIGSAEQGHSVALSADGNTAIVGDNGPNPSTSGAWVFTRTNGVWSQQGNRLAGTSAVGSANQGISVSLSADGNTAIVGGPDDYTGGGAYVFTRNNNVWTQQGGQLVGSGVIGIYPNQGVSVALSGDGDTAVMGGPGDNMGAGAAWVFIRANGVWSQQGNKLVGTGAVGPNATEQGVSVAVSGDGNTVVVGGTGDDDATGAAWVFTRTNGVWTQQGNKLVGNGAVGAAIQGLSVALSGDGNTATVGGEGDNSYTGGAWVFARSAGVWSQQGSKLVGAGAVGTVDQGISVSLSADGGTAIIGGPGDNSYAGAAWVFVQPPSRADKTNTHDFNGDGYSDIAWQDSSGDTAIWLMTGATVLSSGGIGNVPTVWSIVGQRDFNGGGMADLLWRDTSGDTAIWFMNGTTVSSTAVLGSVSTDWTIVSTGDFNGDGYGDILWRDNSPFGNLAMWLMNGAQVTQIGGVGSVAPTWSVVGTGDFNGDGMADLLWRDTSGNTAIWFMNATTVSSAAGIGNIPTSWSVVGTGDFNGDGMSDIVWRDTAGDTAIWLMNGAAVSSSAGLGTIPTTFSIVQIGDYNGDGKSDLLWRDNLGNTSIWFMNGTTVASTAGVGNIPTNWTVQSVNAE
jgi:uncharacterized protein YdbL (DUF1318 family)